MDLVHKIIGFSAQQEDAKDLQRFLSSQEKRIENMKEEELVQHLAQLSPSDHAVGFIRLMQGLLRPNLKDLVSFKQLGERLLLKGSLYADKKRVYKIVRQWVKYCTMDNPKEGIWPLKMAITRLTNRNRNLLTPLHAPFVLLCILSKCYDSAYEVISIPKIDLEPRKNGMNIRDYLEYYYYAGVVLTVLKKFSEALEHFQSVLTAPVESCVSQIQIHAYKKYMLVSLIEYGKIKRLPKQQVGSGVLGKCSEAAGKHYTSMKFDFENLSPKAFEAKLAHKMEDFKEDENWGLCKQLVNKMIKRKIIKLNKTYVTLSFQDVARLAELKNQHEAEEKIANMIEDGEINAVICNKDNIVTFLEAPIESDEAMAKRLKDKIHEAFELSKKLRALDHKLRVNPAFVKKSLASVSRKDQGMASDQASSSGFGGFSGTEDMQLQQVLEKSKLEK
mmetsp:Transcript_22312/g.31211  ORF Transcript_22312/g.31211 Transcript_22312/m.31211 type:complete len:446 (+) Transcript_22312:92-1429(+)|eukprot:CAMPEP_0184495272 /NCGR_PEP_ID=MMETSP0113_2-20130426/30830_1 /TAXON_ID=91329 /ORGANISM="Norrisiella sphaerica, Strain BC52" /LENGTH=445 /DNA_ID=CAMNT_0026881385 /DNA_START=55 /DNA_END=1392 /DNA_ORIENTATION=+